MNPVMDTHTATTHSSRPAAGRPAWRSASRPNYTGRYVVNAAPAPAPVIVLRREIGDVLRGVRQQQGRTLREVSSAAQVSLGYLSEVERGQKEASSELLSSICQALDIPMSLVLREVSDRIAVVEGVSVPDTVPSDLIEDTLAPIR